MYSATASLPELKARACASSAVTWSEGLAVASELESSASEESSVGDLSWSSVARLAVGSASLFLSQAWRVRQAEVLWGCHHVWARNLRIKHKSVDKINYNS